MFRNALALSCLILFPTQLLQAAGPALPTLRTTGEPYQATELIAAVVDHQDGPLAETLVFILRAIENNLGLCARTRIRGFSSSNQFCPVHGIFEEPEEIDHRFKILNAAALSLKKVTKKTSNEWICTAGTPQVKAQRALAIKLLNIIGYDLTTKKLVETALSHTWKCNQS